MDDLYRSWARNRWPGATPDVPDWSDVETAFRAGFYLAQTEGADDPQPPASTESPARGDSTSGVALDAPDRPMTDDEMVTALDSAGIDIDPETAELIVRAVERWHGISADGVSAVHDQTPPPSHADAESPARGGRQG